MTYYSTALKDAAVAAFVGDPDATEEEIALIYGISQTTLSRHLAEKGYKTLKRHKTDRENAMLKYLERKGITNIDDLKKVL